MAQETGWDIDRVIRYAEPPLRERAYVAQCASEVSLHQARGTATLETVMGQSLGLNPDELIWDSSYVGGQWLVQLVVPGNVENAQWTYEPSGKSVNPVNTTARSLMGLDPVRESHTATSRESTIIVDTTSGHPQPRFEAVVEVETQESISAPVKLTAVPELFSFDDQDDREVVEPVRGVTVESNQSTAKKKKGRAKVPSWDEILFGATSTED